MDIFWKNILNFRWLTYIIGIIALCASLTLLLYETNRTKPIVSAFKAGPFAGVYTVKVPDTDKVTLQIMFPVNNGEPEMKTGLLHYVEHLTWFNAVRKEILHGGQDTNASTSNLAVTYWLEGASKDVPNMLKTLVGVFKPLKESASFAKQELGIIKGEYDYRYGDNLVARAQAALNHFLYAGNTIATSPIGTPAQIAALSYDEAKALHKATHRPGKAFLIATGNVDTQALKHALSKLDLPASPQPPLTLKPTPFHLAGQDTKIFHFPDPKADPQMIWRKIITLDKAVPLEVLISRLSLVGDMLDTDLPGGLAGPLRYDAFIASKFDIGLSALDERHVEISFDAEPDAHISFEQLRDAFEKALAATAKSGFPDTTYKRVLDRFDGRYLPDWSDKAGVANFMADYIPQWIGIHRTPRTIAQLKALDDEISPDLANTLMHQLSDKGRTAIAFIGQQNQN